MKELRTIIVTGASSGIGAHCARALKAEGWRVFATARKPEDIAALEADEIEAFYLDYREPDSIAKLLADVIERSGGKLDALFNNGGYSQPGAVEDISVAAMREQFEANFFGWHDLTRRIVPVMRAQGHGRIVHCSSILGLTPVKFRGAYASSKHAVEGLMLCLRAELGGSGIHVSLIEPGPIATALRANSIPHFEKHIDWHGSVHAADYEARLLKRLYQPQATKDRFELPPSAVTAKLIHALDSPRPRARYTVTTPAHAAAVMRRMMPTRLLDRLLRGR